MRLRSWSNLKLSFGGRITLVRSVLSSIPIYQLSFSLLPKSSLRELKSVVSNFLWGGDASTRKIHWIKWDELCLPLQEGGLGVKDFESFNKSLVGKWMWRFLVDKNCLWAKIVRARHGDIHLSWEDNGWVVGRAPKAGWWKRVVEMCFGVGGDWFKGNLGLRLGEGVDISFWNQPWVGESSLKLIFPRLYRVSNNKLGYIRSMGEWAGGVWEWRLEWRRNLFEWERGEVEALLTLLKNVQPTAGTRDNWWWKANESGEYSTKSAYANIRSITNLQNCGNGMDNRELKRLWRAPAPHKATATAWRILKNKIPTCDNLVRRKVPISPSEALCARCSNSTESVKHTILLCSKVTEVWDGLLKWTGFQFSSPGSIIEHFRSFTNLGQRKKTSKILLGIWICAVWTLWRWRNQCKFEKLSWDTIKIIAEIKARVWSWCKVFKITHSVGNFHQWYSSEALALDI